MAFNSYISLIKGKFGAKTPDGALQTTDGVGGDASHTKPAADGLVLDAVGGHNGEAQDGGGTDNARLGDAATHQQALHGITTEVEPVELLEDARQAPGGHNDLGDTATHERNIGGSGLVIPGLQLTSDHGGMNTTDESPASGNGERVLSAQGSGSDEQVVGVTEYGTTDVGHTGGVFSFKSTSGMDAETERMAFSAQGGSGPSGGVQKFDGRVAWSVERGHETSDTTTVNDQTPADWNERSAPSHNLKTEWITSAMAASEPAHGEAAQDVFVTEAVARPDGESNVSVFGVGGGVDDERVADPRVSADGGGSRGFTVKFDGEPAPHDPGHDVKWEGPDFDATKNVTPINDQTPADWNERSAGPGHEAAGGPLSFDRGYLGPEAAHSQAAQDVFVTEAVGGHEVGESSGLRMDGLDGTPGVRTQIIQEVSFPAIHEQPAHDGLMMPYLEQGQAEEPRQEAAGILPYMEGQNAVEGDEPTLERTAPGHEALANMISSLDSDADAPTTLLGDLHHGDQLYTGVNDGSLLGVHDPVGHVDPGQHDLGDVHHGHDAALDHPHHVDIHLDL